MRVSKTVLSFGITAVAAIVGGLWMGQSSRVAVAEIGPATFEGRTVDGTLVLAGYATMESGQRVEYWLVRHDVTWPLELDEPLKLTRSLEMSTSYDDFCDDYVASLTHLGVAPLCRRVMWSFEEKELGGEGQ
jgi:hypothetical protein